MAAFLFALCCCTVNPSHVFHFYSLWWKVHRQWRQSALCSSVAIRYYSFCSLYISSPASIHIYCSSYHSHWQSLLLPSNRALHKLTDFASQTTLLLLSEDFPVALKGLFPLIQFQMCSFPWEALWTPSKCFERRGRKVCKKSKMLEMLPTPVSLRSAVLLWATR